MTHHPDKKSRAQVLSMTGMGFRQDQISRVMDIAPMTLRKHYRMEIDTGAIKANANVIETLYKKAIGGNVVACIYWTKTQCGWKETNVHEHVGEDGGAIEVADARAELLAVVTRQQEADAATAAASEKASKPKRKKKTRRKAVRKKKAA